MKTINLKSISVFTLSIIAVALYLQPSSPDQINAQTAVQTVQHSVKKPLALAVGQIKRPLKSKAAVEPMPEQFMVGQFEVVLENYAEEQILDENWDEDAYVEEQRQNEKFLTESERAARQVIQNLESKIMNARDDFGQDDAVTTQIQTLFAGDNAPNSQLVDLRCSKAVCRLALQTPDEQAQYEAMDALPEQIEWLEQSVAEVTINPDDSRSVTVYLIRPVQDDESDVADEFI